jgi:hypothetical protein
MADRRRAHNSSSRVFLPWWRQEVGGLPAWALIAALLVLSGLAGIVILTLG